MNDIIIIGGGPVGIYASTLASLHGLNGLLIEGLHNLGGQLSSLYPEKDIVDLPGFKSITAQGFINELLNQNNNLTNKLDTHINETFLNYEKKEDYFIIKTNKNEYQTKTILLVSGMGVFVPRKIGLDNENQFKNIIYSIQNKNLYKDKEMVILGGGDSAVDWANTLSSICKKVTIIHRRDEFRAKEEAVKQMLMNNVNILKPYQVKAIKGINDIAQELIITKNDIETSIHFDYLFVNYGLISTPIKCDLQTLLGAYKVDTSMMTSEQNIFAIGNACQYLGKVKNITCGLGEAVIAITKIDQIINPNKNIPIHF